ncbi:MAG: hypothetical protein AAFR47_01630 [Pseudomonadota bacterium]
MSLMEYVLAGGVESRSRCQVRRHPPSLSGHVLAASTPARHEPSSPHMTPRSRIEITVGTLKNWTRSGAGNDDDALTGEAWLKDRPSFR